MPRVALGVPFRKPSGVAHVGPLTHQPAGRAPCEKARAHSELHRVPVYLGCGFVGLAVDVGEPQAVTPGAGLSSEGGYWVEAVNEHIA